MPARTYVVWATGMADPTGGGTNLGDFTLTGNGHLIQEQVIFNDSLDGNAYSISGSIVMTSAGTITLGCVDENTNDKPLRGDDHSLTAIAVNALN